MLVVSRKENERIVMSGGISIVLMNARHGTARIGIQAPRDVQVLREELLSAKDLARLGPPEAPVR